MDSNVMPCRAARPLLPDYLAGELTPSERRLLRGHLAVCPDCRGGLAAQEALEARVRGALHARTEPHTPPPQAAGRLLARLPAGGPGRAPRRPLLKPKGAFYMNTRFVVGILTTLALSFSTAMAAPAARAKVGAFVKTGWHAAVDALEGNAGVDASAEVRVNALFPTYLPAGAGWTANVQSSSDSEVVLEFSRGTEFVVLELEPLSAEAGLAADQYVTINGQTAGLDAGVDGSADVEETLWAWVNRTVLQVDASSETAAGVKYSDGRRLTWAAGEVQAQLTSNLSLDEMIKVAESLRAAADFNGDLALALPQLGAEAEAAAEAEAQVDAAAEAAAEAEAEVEAEVEALVETAAEVEAQVDVNGTVDAAVDAAAEAAAEVNEAVDVEGELDAAVEVEVDAGGGLPVGLP